MSEFFLFLAYSSYSFVDLLSPLNPLISNLLSPNLATASLYLYISGGIAQLTGNHGSLLVFLYSLTKS